MPVRGLRGCPGRARRAAPAWRRPCNQRRPAVPPASIHNGAGRAPRAPSLPAPGDSPVRPRTCDRRRRKRGLCFRRPPPPKEASERGLGTHRRSRRPSASRAPRSGRRHVVDGCGSSIRPAAGCRRADPPPADRRRPRYRRRRRHDPGRAGRCLRHGPGPCHAQGLRPPDSWHPVAPVASPVATDDGPDEAPTRTAVTARARSPVPSRSGTVPHMSCRERADVPRPASTRSPAGVRRRR